MVDVEHGPLSNEGLIQLAAVVAVACVAFGIVTVMRWAEHLTDSNHWIFVYDLIVLLHLVFTAAFVVFLARSIYRWARGRPIR